MLLLLLACTDEAPAPVATEPLQPVAVAPPPQPQSPEPRFSQDELARQPEAITLEGIVRCPGAEGPWTLAVYSAHPEFAGPKAGSLPFMPPLAMAESHPQGHFEIRAMPAEKLWLLAYQDAGERQAFANADASYFPGMEALGALVLDCGYEPAWPREQVPTRVVGEPAPHKEEAARSRADLEWLYETPSAKRDDELSKADFNARVESYRERLGDRADAGDLAASLAMMPDQEVAEERLKELQ